MNGSFDTGPYGISANDSPTNLTGQFPGPEHHPVTAFIENYSIPVLCLLGLCGNSLASLVFLQKSLRNSSSSIFLATKGFSDNGFLSTLLIIWLSRTFQLRIGAISGACQVIIFLSNVCGCISVWLVVFVTLENYIRICRPFIVNRVCKTTTAKLAVIVLCVIAFGIYSYCFWVMQSDTCSPHEEFIHLISAFIYTDTLLTLVVPLVFIIVLMTAILCDLVKSYNRRSNLHAPTVKRVKNPMAKVTKMLLAVTVTFFCLNLPSHVNRMRIMITSFIADSEQSTESRAAEIQQITLLISYLSLTINIFVYLLFGSKFRNVFIQLITCRVRGSTSVYSPATDISARENGSKAKYTHTRVIADVLEKARLTTNTDVDV